MKTTIIEILNKIANGVNIPIEINYKDIRYRYDCDTKDYYSGLNDEYLLDSYSIPTILNNEVEILETTITYKPNNIEKIDMFDYFTGYWYEELPEDFKRHLEINFETLNSKINEIIDKLNGD